MAAPNFVYVAGRQLTCPVCGGNQFQTKNIMIAGELLQAFDLEGFGKSGLAAICSGCSRVEQFANREIVGIGKPIEP